MVVIVDIVADRCLFDFVVAVAGDVFGVAVVGGCRCFCCCCCC